MAGMGTRDINRKIKSINSTMQITKAMELVSTAKLKKSRDRIDITRPYFETVTETVRSIIETEKSIKNEFIDNREVKKSLYIVVTSDRGLCGGYNNNALKMVSNDLGDKDAIIMVVGRKGTDFFTRVGKEIVKSFVGISEKPEYLHAVDIARIALNMYKDKEIDEIKFVYTRLRSTISQEASMIKLLPVDVDKNVNQIDEPEEFVYVNYEPSPEAVLSYIIPKYVESTVYGGLIESAASEQAARRMSMENASDNASEMIDSLTLSFNQARQAAITQEITEIVGGAEALK